ncbi:MAG: NADH-quinone oxidoreductase subunit J [Chloroflexia bacterium]|nr:NADH-quinone oxidoreductase subunit J [Chloroflexia bacterium]
MEANPAMYIAFFALTGLTLLGALAVVTLKNLLHSALSLMITFIGVAGFYFLLQAEFIAVVQILIYIGAVLVLTLFAIMLTERLMEKNLRQFTGKWWLAAPLAGLLFVALIVPAVWMTPWPESSADPPAQAVEALGRQLMTTYVLPFEIASLLLLVALVGAIVIAWPIRDRLPAEEELDAKVVQAKAGWDSPDPEDEEQAT